MTSKDLSIFNSLRPFSIGFDDMFDQFENMLGNGHLTMQSNYPPYNIRKTGKDNYAIELALAGFSKDDVEVEIYSDEGKLVNLKKQLNPGESILIDEKYLNPKSLKSTFLWFVAKSKRPDLAAQSFHTHLQTGHTSGEHNF